MQTHFSFPDPQVIGQFKRFGPFGPAYEIIEPVKHLQDGDWLVRIKVLETGEETDYRYSHLKNDPEAK